MSRTVDVLFTTETINRELDAQLMMAGLLSKEGGVRSFVGRLDSLRSVINNTERGVVVGRVFDPNPFRPLDYYNYIKSRGFALVHLDEEGGIFPGDEANWYRWFERRLDPSILGAEDVVCTWGEMQRAYYAGRDNVKATVVATGHPRFDLYRPEYRGYFGNRVGDLKRRFGRYVLVNTSTSTGNSPLPAQVFSKRLGYYPDNIEARTRYIAVWAGQVRALSGLVELINKLTIDSPGVHFVVRPHPTESRELYKNIFGEVPNVSVIVEGSVNPWLLGAEGLVYNNCTTSVEAHFADVPSINFHPSWIGEEGFMYIPSLFGTRCADEASARNGVRDMLDRDRPRGQQTAVEARAVSLIRNFESPALPRVVDAIRRAVEERRARGPASMRPIIPVDARIRAGLERGKNAMKQFSKRRRIARDYSLMKFPGFSAVDVMERWARVRETVGTNANLVVHSHALLEIR